MVFSSLFFLYLFLPANLIAYALAKTMRQKNTVMMIFSLVFYAWGEPVYVLLLVGMAFADWVLALRIGVSLRRGRKRAAKLGVAAVCAVDLGLLGVFKYGTFFLQNLKLLTGFPETVPQILLPIGISFYTFQLISYAVDVYRGEVKAQRDFSTLLLYVSLFHQCIAGPIVRYRDIERELWNRKTDITDIYAGVTRFTVGLGKKALLANPCGALADSLLISDAAAAGADAAAALAGKPALSLWLGMLAFMLQIYLDFSAYSDMAIGMGRMLGFHYKENFNYPYTASSVTDFWRRWHMSLSYFFRDYVYIPLGGSRQGKLRTYRNLLIVWTLTGFWHGASWNYMLWGLYFFVFLMLERTVLAEALPRCHMAIRRLYLLAVVYFGWILFRFENLSLAGVTLRGMFGLNGNGFSDFETFSALKGHLFFLLAAIVAVTPLVARLGAFARRKLGDNAGYGVYALGRAACAVLLLFCSTAALVGNSYNPFLYFQF